MTQPLVDSGEFRRVGQREVPWPAFAVSVRRQILGSHAQQVRAVLDVVTRYASNLKRRKTAPSLIADTYGIRLADAEKWLASVRWGGSYRRPTAALARIAKALETQAVMTAGRYDPNKGGEFFDYLQFRLLLVERDDPSPAVRAIEVGGHAQLVEVEEVSGFYEQVGSNTTYIIHPEEIMADEHIAARGFPTAVHHDDLDRDVVYPGAPFVMSATPWRIAGRAPRIGEHQHLVFTPSS